jgi:ferric-dicitrate binding protein FerR (iron transport regulator)
MCPGQESVVSAIVRFLAVLLLYGLSIEAAAAQAGNFGCTQVSAAGPAQTLRCDGGITLVAENGASYTLSDTNHDGRVDQAELRSKALLIDVPKKAGGKAFQVNTPQAIAAVRGTKWAVDATADKTSVFVARGSVAVRRPAGGSPQVVLGPGEGVDVEATGPLTVKRWAPARVAALMARLGQ